MKSILIKNGWLLSPSNGYHQDKKDILLVDGLIAKIADEINAEAEIVDATGCLVTPGLIDIHTHCFPTSRGIGLYPDELGLKRGATTILDAGTSGPYNYDEFKKIIDASKTKVFTLMNISKEGLAVPHELDSLDKIDEEALKQVVSQHQDNIIGLKVRASASVVGEMGLEPIGIGARIAHELDLPLMVHVGNYPPALHEVLELLDKNDIVTHAFHGKKGGILEEGQIIPQAIQARERGVLFDIGHGSASFSFNVYQEALSKGFDCDLISTDLHVENYEGPVYNLAAVLSKCINCNESLEEAIYKVTTAPAKHYHLSGLGELKEGYIGDLSLMKLVDCNKLVVDSMGDECLLSKELKLIKTIYSRGNQSEIYQHNYVAE